MVYVLMYLTGYISFNPLTKGAFMPSLIDQDSGKCTDRREITDLMSEVTNAISLLEEYVDSIYSRLQPILQDAGEKSSVDTSTNEMYTALGFELESFRVRLLRSNHYLGDILSKVGL